jgi:hypothetical protein
MDLSKWLPKHFDAPFWMKLKTMLGANRWRCEYCRIYFASFRQRKEIFSFQRWHNLNTVTAVADGRARMADLEAKAVEQRETEQRLARAAAKAEATDNSQSDEQSNAQG